jgi:erythromycin esterase-like protein
MTGSSPIDQDRTIASVREAAVPLSGAAEVPDEVMRLCSGARFVLLGEASHGTHEFYRSRAEITKRLIADENFSALAVEADFPDAYRVNRYIRRQGGDSTAREALTDFRRYPLWMWRNADILDLVGWLRDHNDRRAADKRVGFYGIDLYSLHSSMDAVLNYLDRTDREAATRARYRYSCFEAFGEDPQHYGYAASFDLSQSCEDEAVRQLTELRARAADYMNRDGFVARDEFFFAEQNARLVKNAEEYYREMFRGRVSSWNLRDRHMTETLVALSSHLEAQNLPPKIVVWAHNSHLGDARATEMGRRGEWNIGQLIRQKFPGDVVNIGYTTYSGTVTATSNWDEPAQPKRVRPGLNGSFEDVFHRSAVPNFFLNLHDPAIRREFSELRLERAIGVIYRPETERLSHYFHADLPKQFDGVIHFDKSRAVEPIDAVPSWTHEDAPETFPVGI